MPENSTAQERETTPTQENMALTTPMTGDAAYARVRVQAVEDSVGEIKSDIRDIKDHRHPDFVHLLQIFGGGFVLLASMLIGAYFIIDSKFDKVGVKFDKVDEKFEKLNDRIDKLSTTSTRVDVKLEDLLARIPPVPTPSKR